MRIKKSLQIWVSMRLKTDFLSPVVIMKKALTSIITLLLIITAVLFSYIIATANGDSEETTVPVESGWVITDGKRQYYDENGVAFTGWLLDNGKYYYLDKDGFVTTGWELVDGYYYYFENDGAMLTGWYLYKGKWYYLNDSGKMRTGWLYEKGKWYYFNPNGAMKTGWLNEKGKWYYFNPNGAMKIGWLNEKGKWYYLTSNGAMKTGWLNEKGKWYYLASNGVMKTGFVEADGHTYYMLDNGRYYCGWSNDSQVFSRKQIESAVKTYSVKKDSNTFLSVLRINSEYSEELSSSDKDGTLLFLMEGAGRTNDISLRKFALCVLVRDGKIIYMNINCSTIPDCPFDPSRNYGSPMPTLKSGIYNFTTTYHSSATTQCAGLNVNSAKVVRHRTQTDYYSSTSSSINIHRRNRNYVAKNDDEQISSAGCLLIGNSGKSSTDDYAQYSAILGITDPGDSGTASVKHNVSGKVIVDRYFAKDYLKSIGYTEGAIELIG